MAALHTPEQIEALHIEHLMEGDVIDQVQAGRDFQDVTDEEWEAAGVYFEGEQDETDAAYEWDGRRCFCGDDFHDCYLTP